MPMVLHPCAYCHQPFLIKRHRLTPDRKRYCSQMCFRANVQQQAEEQRENMLWGKRCTKCLLIQPTTEFYPRNDVASTPFRSHCKTCSRAKNRDYAQSHTVQAQQWVYTHRMEVRGYKKTYAVAHPDKVRMHMALRRARFKNAPKVIPVNPLDIAKRDNWRCHICGKKVSRKNWSMDHLIPLVHGGSHTHDNIALAHFLCNARRGSGSKIPAQLRLLS